ncbi:MAG TPA: hypothetical protein VNU92_07720 [Edaphobacter sp.]|jgi:tetratricopeptide (TPR) repeat protein|nr:hypothetical protein [Edaphobacter sp.]
MENGVPQGGQGAQKSEKASVLKLVMSWVGGVTAVIGLIGSLSGGVHWLATHRTQRAQLASQMAVAATQMKQQEYEASVHSYGNILKSDPLYAPALEGQLDATMLWVDNFSVLGKEHDEDRTAQAAGVLLDEIMPILDAGLARSTGSRAADVQAHLGWAHWLNWHIAQREISHLAEQNLRAAVQLDKTNPYANSMLGNWMLQNGGAFPEAIEHFNTAVASGKARSLVREMQVGGLLDDQVPGARKELVKSVNDMRKNGEPLDNDEKYRIRSFCFSTLNMEQDNLAESLSAVPEDDAWKTYLWLGDNRDDNTDPLARDFVYATLLDVSGKRAEALQKFRLLQQNPRSKQFSFSDRIDQAVERLSKG